MSRETIETGSNNRHRANRAALGRKGFEEISPRVWSRESGAKTLRRIAATDLFISDFDECLCPAISQAVVGLGIFRRVLLSPFDNTHSHLVAGMARNAGRLVGKVAVQRITGRVQNSKLNRTFEQFVKGIPDQYFQDAIGEVAPPFSEGAPRALEIVAKRGVPVGVVSLGINNVMDRLLERMESEHGVRVNFRDCNEVEIDDDGLFVRYSPEKTYTENEDKRYRVRARVEEYGARHVLVVGHDCDDIMMFDEAKKLGGTALGFSPAGDVLDMLDIAVIAPDWRPVADLFEEAFGV